MASRKLRTALMVMVALSLCFTSVFAGGSQAAAAEADDAQQFVQLINDLRASKGLGPLQTDSQLTQASQGWTTEMSSSDTLQHSSNIASGLTHNWSVLGENVGVHGIQGSQGVQDLFNAFVASPVHYQNLIDPRFQYIGIGVVYNKSNNKIWTTHRFMALHSTPTTTAAPTTTRPPTTAAPATTAPTTTRPTTTRPTVTTRPTTTRPPTTELTTTLPTTPSTAPSTSTTGSSTSTQATTQRTTQATTQRTTQAANQAATQTPSPTTASAASPPSELAFANSTDRLVSFEGINRFTKAELLVLVIEGFQQES